MDLDAVKQRIEADQFEAMRRGNSPLFTGLGVIRRPGSRPFLEVRSRHVDSRWLTQALAAKYGVRAAVVRVDPMPTAIALGAAYSGASIGHFRCSCSGTIGALIYGRNEGRWFVLSNSHVLALNGVGRAGDPLVDQFGSPLGELVLATQLDPRNVQRVDAALGMLHPEVQITAQQFRNIARVQPGATVTKNGAATGVTAGTVVCTDYTQSVHLPTGNVWFTGQIAVERSIQQFAAPGDSGSMVQDVSGNAVGLLFAADQIPAGDRWRGFANPMPEVLAALGLR